MTQKFEIKYSWNDDREDVRTVIVNNCWELMGYLGGMSQDTDKPDGMYLISVREVK